MAKNGPYHSEMTLTTTDKGQLLTVPPNAFAFFVIIGNAWWSDRRRERPMHILGGLVLVAIGYVLLASVTGVGGRYVGVFLIACTNAAVMPFVAYRTATVTGATSTAIATGGVIAIANISGAVAPFLFAASTAPRYYPGLWTLFAMLAAACAITGGLWYKLGGSSEYRGQVEEPPVEEDAEVDGEKKAVVEAGVTEVPDERRPAELSR